MDNLRFTQGLHPIQEAIHLNHGTQCGFCTPGMVMSMSSELRDKLENCKEDGLLDVEDMERCLQGNLCRCTGYRPILESYEHFCKGNSDATSNVQDAKKLDPKIPNEILDGKLVNDFLHFEDDQVRRRLNYLYNSSLIFNCCNRFNIFVFYI